MDAYISFASEAKQIGLDERNCTLKDGTKVPCTRLSSCLQYDGIGVGRALGKRITCLINHWSDFVLLLVHNSYIYICFNFFY